MLKLTPREQVILDALRAGERDVYRLAATSHNTPSDVAKVVRRLVSLGVWRGSILELGGRKVAVNV